MQQLQGAVETLVQENGRLAAQVDELQRGAADSEAASSEASAAAAEARWLCDEVQRVKLERKVLKVVTKVALAVITDLHSGERRISPSMAITSWTKVQALTLYAGGVHIWAEEAEITFLMTLCWEHV